MIVRRVAPARGARLRRLAIRLIRPARQPHLTGHQAMRRSCLDSCLQREVRQAGVIVGTATERPEILALGLADGQVVDARVAAPHQPVTVELPVFVSVGAEPVSAVVVPLVREANGDAITAHRPELLDQTVVQLPGPLAGENADALSQRDTEADACNWGGCDRPQGCQRSTRLSKHSPPGLLSFYSLPVSLSFNICVKAVRTPVIATRQ